RGQLDHRWKLPAMVRKEYVPRVAIEKGLRHALRILVRIENLIGAWSLSQDLRPGAIGRRTKAERPRESARLHEQLVRRRIVGRRRRIGFLLESQSSLWKTTEIGQRRPG